MRAAVRITLYHLLQEEPGVWRGFSPEPRLGFPNTPITAQAGIHLSLEIPHVQAGPRGRGAWAPRSQIQEPEF